MKLGRIFDCPGSKSVTIRELRAFCRYIDSYGIDRIVESGTFRGVTAVRLSVLYPSKEIITFEKSRRVFEAIPDVYLKENVDFRRGKLKDNLDLVTNTTAVLIDGPKKEGAIKLAKKCLKRCRLIAIHDMDQYKERFFGEFKGSALVDKLGIITR